MDTTRTVLVLGATGGIGGATARALGRRGWRVRALARDAAAAAAAWPADAPGGTPIEWLGGDAMCRDDVLAAADGVAVIVHAVNPPGYRDWDTLVLPMIDNTIAAARAAGGARIVLPGTLYNYDPAHVPVIGADTPQRPVTDKGRDPRRARGSAAGGRPRRSRADRARRRLLRPRRPPELVLAGDDPARPPAPTSHAPGAGRRSRVGVPARPRRDDRAAARRERPDACLRTTCPSPATSTPTVGAMVDAVRRAVGRSVPVRRFPWWAMRALAPFGGFPREALEIAPSWRHAQRLDGARLAELVDDAPHTPLDAAVHATLAELGCLDAGSPSHPSPVSSTTHRSQAS